MVESFRNHMVTKQYCGFLDTKLRSNDGKILNLSLHDEKEQNLKI